MRAIASDFFANSPLMAGPQIAMLLFLAVFVAVLFRVMRSRASHWDGAARLPLEEHPVMSGTARGEWQSKVRVGEEAGHE